MTASFKAILGGTIFGLAVGLVPSLAAAQTYVAPKKLSLEEATQLFAAAGYKINNGKATNMCGTVSSPKVAFIDLNLDGQVEAVTIDNDACFGGNFISVVAKKPAGQWGWLFRTEGTITWEKTRTKGWYDAKITTTCDTIWKYNGTTYAPSAPCPKAAVSPAASAPAAKPQDASYTAAFLAAGFKAKGKTWIGCDGDSTAEILPGDVRDLNKDGRAEVIITETSGMCYGNTGQGFYLMTTDPAGKWRTLYSSSGIPEFLSTSSMGWQDIEVGGPGFCFPVLRWDGKTYKLLRRQAKSADGCKYAQ